MEQIPVDQLYEHVIEGIYKKNKLKLRFGSVFTSNIYTALQTYKIKKRNKE